MDQQYEPPLICTGTPRVSHGPNEPTPDAHRPPAEAGAADGYAAPDPARVATAVGDAFFDELVRYLCDALGVETAMVAELPYPDADQLTAISACRHGRIVRDFGYGLTGAPCGQAVWHGPQTFTHGLGQRFPGHDLVAELGAQSYVGLPLHSADGTVIGVLSVMGTSPLDDPGAAEATLARFAERASAELARRRDERDLRTSEACFRTLVEHAPDAVVLLEVDTGRFVLANGLAEQLFGMDREALLAYGPAELSPPRQPDGRPSEEAAADWVAQALAGGTPTFEWVHRNASGEDVPCEVRLVLLPDPHARLVRGSMTDIRERKAAEAHRRKLSGALEQSADVVIITDTSGVIEYVNRAFTETTGYSAIEVVGGRPSILRSGRHSAQFYARLWNTIAGGEVFTDIFVNRRKDGSLFYEEKTITPLKDEAGRVTHFISTGKDITERMEAQEHLRYLAYHDTLTELLNRAGFNNELDEAIAQAKGQEGRLALLLLDLDQFKIINDTLGHDVGDRALGIATERIRDVIRGGDVVGRIGGDEFAIVMRNPHSRAAVANLADTLCERVSRPFRVGGREFFLTASVGVSLYPDDGRDGASLMGHADSALYRAKERGRDRYQFYVPELGARAMRRLGLETALRRALEAHDFTLHYQPQVELASRRIDGVEALLRWWHPEWGLVRPVHFIDLAEDTGLILPLGEWVLETACAQAEAWRNNGLHLARIAINLSARQFYEPGLVATVEAVLEKTGLAPEVLELEITEHALMRNVEETHAILRSLREMNIGLAIDDFGTGYSSLSYLKYFPVNRLKIDRAFVHDVQRSREDLSIITTITAMATNLGLEVVAEGVESQEQADLLIHGGCTGAQGYLFSEPVPAAEAAPLISRVGNT